MRVTEKMKKVFSSLLVLSMVLSYVPVPAMAEEVCPHHVHNTEVCGFVEGAGCTHEHGEGCGDVTVTKCVHVHGQDGCTYVPGTPAVFCHPTHTEECGYDAGSGCQCDLSEGKAHLEGCGFVEAAPCTVTHEGCGCAAEVPATGECNHGECTAETGCVTTRFVCAHTAHEGCGYVEAKPCTYDSATCAECAEPEHTHVYDGTPVYAKKDAFVHTVTRACTTCEEQPTVAADEVHSYTDGLCVCGEAAEPEHTHVYDGAPVYAKKDAFVHTVTRACTTCEEQPTVAADEVHSYTDGLCVCGEAEPVKCTCESTDPGEHAPFCALYVRTYEECKCVLDCAEEGLNDWCETCYFEGVEACTGGEEEAVPFVVTSGTTGDCTWVFDAGTGTLTISGNGAMGGYTETYYTWNEYRNEITAVVFENGVTKISSHSFVYFESLQTVTIPASVTEVGPYAFDGCESLTTVYVDRTEEEWNSSVSKSNAFPKGVTFIYKEPTTYTVSVSADPAEGGTVTGGGSYVKDTSVTLTAAANEGYEFVNWTENSTEVSTNASYAFTVTGNRNLVANFEEKIIPGTITITYPLNNTVLTYPDYGTAMFRVTAEVTNGSALTYQWYRCNDANKTGAVKLENENEKDFYVPQGLEPGKYHYYCTVSAKGAESVDTNVVYADVKVANRITLTSSEGGSVIATKFNSDTALTSSIGGIQIFLKPTPGEGYRFKEWQVISGGVSINSGNNSFYMPDRDVEIKAIFAPLHEHSWTYTVSGATVTATCGNADGGCPNTDGGSVTLSAADATYDGNPKPAALSAASIGGIDNLSVVYEGLSSAPVNAGTYTAKLTVGEKEVSVTYTIAPKAVRITGVTAVSRAYEAGSKTVAVTAVTTDDTGVTVTVPADYTGTLASDAVGSYSAITLDLSGLTLSSSNHCFAGAGENLVTDVSITGTVSEADVTGLEDSYAYTGAAIQPEPVVTANGVTLVKDTDYTVAYGENINAAAGGTVTVTGKGLYSGTVRKTFTIAALEIKDEHVVLTPADAVYDGNVKSTVITVVMDGKTVDPQNYEVTGLDAIGSAVGKYPVTVTGKGNYTGTVTKNFEITVKQLGEDNVTLTADLTYNAKTQKPTVTVKNGDVTLTADTDYAVSYEKVIAGEAAVPVTGAPKDAGSYNAVITGKGNYSGEVRKLFAIKPNTNITVTPETLPAVTYTGNAIAPTVTVKGVNDAVLVRNLDYTVTFENNTNAGTAKVTVAGIGNYAGAKKELTFTIRAKELKDADVTLEKTVLLFQAGKKTVPVITVKDGTKTLKEGTDYTVSYLGNNGTRVEEPIAVGTYTVKVIGIASVSEDGSGNYSGTVTKTFVITDDTTNPVITGVTNGKTYYTTQKATVKDDNLVSVTKNGTAVVPVVSAGTEVTLAGNATVTYTVAAKDIAEHTASVTVSMKPISTLDDTIENLTVANVKLTDKTAVQAVLDEVNPIRTGECANATQAEKDALDAIVKKANDLMKVITDVESTLTKIAAMPDAKNTQPDHENAIKTYEAAKKAYDALTDHGKALVGTENKAKLDAMYKALTDYDIIKGHKSSYTRYSGKTFSITANGYYGKFTGVKVDGKLLDPKYYTGKSGSTIVTFDNVYLDSLTDGKHSVEFLYTDGCTGADHYFRIATNNGSPFTGDNDPVVIFSGIMALSLLGMVVLLLNRKKFFGK